MASTVQDFELPAVDLDFGKEIQIDQIQQLVDSVQALATQLGTTDPVVVVLDPFVPDPVVQQVYLQEIVD